MNSDDKLLDKNKNIADSQTVEHVQNVSQKIFQNKN